MFYVYLLRSEDRNREFYIGSTTDLKRRYKEHNEGKSPYTKDSSWKLVYYEAYTTLKAAREREELLKHDGRSRRFLMERIKKHLE